VRSEASDHRGRQIDLDERDHKVKESIMTTTYFSGLSAAIAHEHINDLLRAAAQSRAAAKAPSRQPHRTPRRRALWWDRVLMRRATARFA
jgi:hypothetical protein